MKNYLKRTTTFFLALLMLLSVPLQAFAEINGAGSNENNSKQKEINYDETPIVKERYINKAELPVIPAKAKDKPAKEYVANPQEPKLYNIKFDYKVQRGDDQIIAYQPYIATVGEKATEADKKKMERNLKYPILDGYTSPTKEANLSYDYIVKHSDKKDNKIVWNSGYRAQFYKPNDGIIKVKHVFQDFENPSEYGKLPGRDKDIITEQTGVTGTSLKIQPIPEKDRVGYVPESNDISTQVPENIEDFEVEYRYNRANFSVTFDTGEGTPIPARTLYYAQKIPKIDKTPTKIGSDFLGWKPSVDLKTEDGNTFKANEIIKNSDGEPILDLDAQLIMPGSKVTFTAVWKDKEKADYAVQFWAEKADHADDASLLDKYDYIGTRVYKDQNTGMRPDLANESVKDIVFPDLDKARLAKIWKGEKLNRGKDLYLNKFFVYNQALTADQNKDPENVNLVKTVDATGKTVYNIYYDRQVYELYFTKSNALPAENTFYPEIWGYDEANGEAVKKGGPGNPYHYKARFNQLMLGWPNDAMQTKGFSEGMQSFGWGPNFSTPNWPTHLDTPPYRLNADEFLDMENYDKWGGYTKKIDKGDGTNIDLKWFEFTTLSFGIKQSENSMPHHMDFWMDGFKDDETIIRYDLYRYKADTNSDTYAPKYPQVQGFTGKRGNETPEYLDSDGIDAKNDERADVTPFPDKTYTDMYGARPVGEMKFIKAFFNNADDWGDPDGWDGFDTNGYLKFEYTRNKYPLRFNYDPSKIKGDNEFNSTNSLDTFYEFPLKALSPDADTEESYKTENPKNILDNPEKLQELGLKDLVFTDTDGKLKVKRPDNLSDQMVFKGWALDPAGTKLIWENPGEKMPNHPVNLYANWGEPDYKWKVTFDPNGGKLPELYKDSDITTEEKTIKEGDIGQEEKRTYPTSEMDGDKRIANVIQRQKLREPEKPIRDGYEFLGWELVRFKKDPNGNDTKEVDNSYRNDYKVPELYSFGNDVVSDLYLKAIWVKTNLIEIKSYHHFLDLDYKEINKPEEQNLKNKRVGSYVSAVGSRQNAQWILVPRQEFEDLLEKNEKYNDSSMTYKEYQNFDPNNKRTNSYNQQIRVEPKQITDTNGKEIDNPDAKYNVFHFFYRKFRQREYYVNYLDIRGKVEVENFIKETKKSYTDSIKNNANLTEEEKAREYKQFLINQKKEFEKITKKYSIIDQEKVTNGNRHMDARNFRPIDGWVLDDEPQQQLFFDINENTNAFFGINETGLDEINFFYKDARVIEVKDKNDPLPDGYVRVTFVADEGGSFGKDGQGKDIKELYYDVVKGLKSDSLPVPGELKEGETKVDDKYYITPDNGKKFIEWDKQKLLNDNTIIEKNYTFTAYFDWSGAAANPMVITEAFKDPNNTWTNDFAPKIADLKKQLVWMEKGAEKPLPTGAVIKLYDEAGNELTTDDQVYDLVNEKGKADKDELVRTVNVKAKVTFTDGKDPQELDIPITVYKNVYEALTTGNKPLFLTEAEGKKAEKGGLSDVTGNYVKVTVNPTGKPGEKDSKIYYVNSKAWVDIKEIDISDVATNLGFTNWSADKDGQNENGVFDFSKRHKFTEDTVITPGFSKDVIPQTGTDKPKVPDNYVKVIVKTTDKAVTEFTKTFWVNPTKTVTIPVVKPVGKTVDKTATEAAKAWTFTKWQSTEQSPKTWTNEIKGQFTEKETTIIAQYADVDNIIPYDPSKTDPMPRPDGYVRVSFAADDGLSLTEQKAYYVKKNAGIKLGNSELTKPGHKEETGYKFTNWDKEDTLEIKEDDVLVTAKAKVLPDFDTVNHTGYVKVTFKAGDNGVIKENGNEIGEKVYYVNPNKYVNLKAPTPEGNTGYDFAAWSSDQATGDFSLANFVNYTKDTVITAKFNQKDAVYPKLDGSTKPAGYVEVTFAISGTGGKIADGEVKTYYVDPNRQVSLKAPKTVAGTGFVFDGWRLEDNTTADKINPADQRQYPNKTTIYGSFTKLKDVIPATNDDGTPNLQPIDYVAVLFIGGDHANKVDGQILYYVNPNADPAKTIGNLTKPTVTPDTGWKHTGWDVKDSTVIKDYMFVVAQYTALDDVIEKVDANTKKPDGYVTVTFKSGDNGKIQEKGSDIKEKVYYVNPAKYVKLTPPTTVPNTSYEFSTWCSEGKEFILANNINFTKDTTITAKFNTKGDVIPKTKNDDSQKPQGFVTVDFVIDSSQAGKIKTGETITYFVKPNTDVTIQPPNATANVGYEFEKWSIDTTTANKYTTDTTVKGEFKKLDEIIPSKNPDGTVNAKPEGYVIVNFLKGDHGVLDGKTTFYVNPNAGKTLADIEKILELTILPNPTYKFDKWDKAMDTAITGPGNLDVTATYTQLPNIIKAGPKDTAPDGYVVIIFETDGRGTLTGNAAYEKTPPASKENEIVYFVNPKKNIKLAKLADGATPTAKQLAIPSTTPNDPNKYIFDQWRADIDTETTITRGRVHIAMFKPKVVKLTYDANGATGDVPPVLTVDYDANVRLANIGKLAKKNARFKGWKIGDKIYQAGDQINLKEDTTAYAQWDDDKKIIEYDPVNNPTTRPDDTYVRVTFAVEDGLKLTEQKAYYVKKDAGIKLGDTGLVKPGYKVETGYKSDKWDKEDSLEITTDVLVTAKATKLGTVIPEKDTNGNPNTKPEGYKEVVFKVKDEDQSKGTLEGVTKFYVNPTEYVTINTPTTKANTGFEFGTWDNDAKIPTVYDKDTTITGSFNGLKDVVPKTKDDDSEKPKGYVTVTFEIESKGGKIADKEVTVYYVNPAKDLTVPQPKTQAETGYVFEKWDKDTTTAKKYTADTTVKGNFKKLDDIIPSTDEKGKPNAKPEGYVTVTFDKGEHGTKIEGQTVYYVNPNAGKKLSEIKKPTVKETEIGWKQKADAEAWNTKDTFEIKEDKTVKAQYKEIADIVPKTTNDESEKPAGYITVTFVKGEHGKELTGQAVYYVNPNKAVVLKDKAPTAVPKTGYKFARWDISIDQAIQYKDGAKITALYNEPENISTTEVEGYVKVEFKPGTNGSLEGTQTYWIKPEVEVNIPAPTVKPNVGHKFNKWDKSLTVTANKNDTTYEITAGYTQLDNIIPQKNTDGTDKPNGYVTVTFVSDGNGTLSGTKVYYAKPDVKVELTEQANSITKTPNLGYTVDGGAWVNDNGKKIIDTFKKDETFKFTFKELKDVIPAGDKVEKPERYVKVEFTSDDNGSLEGGDKTYYVNPSKKVKVGSTNLPIPTPKPNDNYTFVKWLENINKKEEITTDKKYVATFKINKVTMTYKADDKTSGSVPAALSYEIGTEITIAGGNDLKKDNAVLIGWKIGDKTYKPGEKFTINADTTASAVWEAGLHTVNFDTVGGTHIDSQQVKHEGLITPVGNPKKDGYFFVGWKIKGTDKVFDPTKDKVTEDITLVAQYSKDIIPEKDDGSKPEGVPDSFVLVEFKKGSNGTLTGTTKYWVNPTAGKKLSDIAHPSVTANDGWKHTGWDKTEDTEINNALKVTAKYLEKVLTEQPTENAEKYVKVEFKPGDHGTIDANTTSTYWVLKDEAVTLTPPAVNPNTGYAQKTGDGAWSPKVETSYSRDTEHVAQYDYNGDDVISQPGPEKPDNVPENFVLVEFKPGDHGTIAGTTKYWVNPTKLVTLTPPTVTPNTGYEQEKGFGAWDKYLKDMFTEYTVITAQYRKLEEPCPPPTPDPDKPNPDNPNPWDPNPWNPDYPNPDNPYYPERPYIPMYPEVRYETVIQEKVVEVPVPEKPYMKEVRYMQGFKGDFRPKDGLTRAEAAQILANALVEDGYKYNPNFKLSYKDIGEAWYTRAVKIVTEANVFSGYDDGNFKPEDKITRNEWIATLKRFQELGDVSGNHMKLKDGHWAMGEIEAAYEEGWLKIYTDGLATYEGDEFIPREEVAAVSNKAFKRILDKTYIRNNEKNLISYKDVKKDMWSYEDILCASNTFLYKKDLYRAHWIKEDNNKFNVNTDGFEILKAKFQRNPR